MDKFTLDQHIRIDLTNSELFINDELLLEKTCNIVYGKNGTGKSTLLDIISEQFSSDFDVLSFQGFEKIINADRKLNAIVLGEANVEIDNTIKELEKSKKEFEDNKNRILGQIEKNDDKDSLYNQKSTLDQEIRSINIELDKKYSLSATLIKKMENPRVSNVSYNKTKFIEDIQNAKSLSNDEYNKCLLLQKEEVKTAKEISLREFDYEEIISNVNELRNAVIEETVIIDRLEGNNEKKQFAEKGLAIHSVGDKCAFCGNTITKQTIIELKSYFSADKIKELQAKLKQSIQSIELLRDNIIGVNISNSEFYSYMESEVTSVISEFDKLKREHIQYLEHLINALNDKQKDLFTQLENFDEQPPNTLKNVITLFNECVKKNNESDLEKSKEEAKNKLRLHEVKRALEEMSYEEKQQDINNTLSNCNLIQKQINVEKEKIEGKDGIDEKIELIDTEISQLKSQTISETKLADEINKKLKRLVNFEMVHHQSSDGQNYYKIKSLKNDSVRNVDELSTGEKNIIAFLYFVGKINEFRDNPDNRSKFIIFDDPMNSNDDVMQYLMIQELQKIMNQIKKPNLMVILTHNKHFYLNVRPYNKPYVQCSYFHFQLLNQNTQIIHIENQNSDFKTSYDALWCELNRLYNADKLSSDILLNPIRRIIETYINFNSISKNCFFEKNQGARKMFDVNSHSIDDLEAELNGLTKEQIIDELKECFKNNNALSHFEKHWGTD